MPLRSGLRKEEDEGPAEASGPPKGPSPEGKTNQAQVLQAIDILRQELSSVRQDICAKIDSRIEDVNTTLRREIHRLETNINPMLPSS